MNISYIRPHYLQLFRSYASGFFDLPPHNIKFISKEPVLANYASRDRNSVASAVSINGRLSSDVFLQPSKLTEESLRRTAFMHAFSLARIHHGLSDSSDSSGVPHFFAERLFDFIAEVESNGKPIEFVNSLWREKSRFNFSLERAFTFHQFHNNQLPGISQPNDMHALEEASVVRLKQNIADLAVLSVVDSNSSIDQLRRVLRLSAERKMPVHNPR
ncbi:hypothetical protein HUU53_04575, partial [Candidatus Micrarchaeota archaeon]|nr:hypothetical protein [Candidatus Micrarchaeota archaeon]